ncbi:hypothetical protein [Nocardia wallacei]|uniref:hypothetical protein n=1 Tax=Nocardia wallacei TaxID=480035 RepID=UPI00245522A0|nr:hypothetical protein [Nocardia wallacei]
MSRIGRELRQRRYHRAFRIAPPDWDERGRRQLQQLLSEFPCADDNSESPPPLDEHALAEAATSLWRAERKLRSDSGDPAARARQARRYLDRTRQALTGAGLVVHDHDGDAFHPGRSLDVLAFQDDPALTAETVIQTVRPTVYFRDRRIQTGQVIVGCPAEDGSGAAEHDGGNRE